MEFSQLIKYQSTPIRPSRIQQRPLSHTGYSLHYKYL